MGRVLLKIIPAVLLAVELTNKGVRDAILNAPSLGFYIFSHVARRPPVSAT